MKHKHELQLSGAGALTIIPVGGRGGGAAALPGGEEGGDLLDLMSMDIGGGTNGERIMAQRSG